MTPVGWLDPYPKKWIRYGCFMMKTVSNLRITELNELYVSVSFGENAVMVHKVAKETDGSSESCLSNRHAESERYPCSQSLWMPSNPIPKNNNLISGG